MPIIYAINHVLEATLFYYYTFSLHPHKHKRYIDMLIIGIGYSCLFAFFMFKLINLNIIIQLSIYPILYICTSKNTIWGYISDSVLTLLFITLSELLFDIPTVLFHQETTFDYSTPAVTFLAMIIMRITHLILIEIVLHFKKKNLKYTKTQAEEILSTLLLIVCTAAVISIQELGFVSILSSDQIPWVFVILLSIISLTLGFLFSLTLLRKKQSKLSETKNELQRLEDEKNYEKLIKQLDYEQKLLIHDFRKHLSIIQEYLTQNDLQTATSHISELTRSKALSGGSILTCNHTLSVLLSRYITLCKEQGIDLSLDVKEADLLYLCPSDVTSLFCNLIDNAIETSLLSGNPSITLHISKDHNRSSDIITITNTCQSRPSFENTGILATAKKDKLRHGFGMKSIQRVVDRYHGTMDLQYIEEDLLFQVTICLYRSEETQK